MLKTTIPIIGLESYHLYSSIPERTYECHDQEFNTWS